MSFRVFSRSVKAANRPASIRPDSVDIYMQLDVYHDHLTASSGSWTKQVAPCRQNVNILSSRARDETLFVANPFRLIKDVVICTASNEDDDDYQSLEDGRSRRYFLKNGTFAHMFSFPLEDCYVPVTFETFPIKSDKVGTFRLNYLRLCRFGPNLVELLVCIVGGKNLSIYAEVKLTEYHEDIINYLIVCERTLDELNEWKKNGRVRREFVMLLSKDHCAPIEVFDPQEFYRKHGRRWNLTDLEASAIESDADAGYFDIHGFKVSSDDISVSTTKYDYDDHSPCLFEVITKFQRIPMREEREHLRSYYLDRPWKGSAKYRKHDGTIISEYEMSLTRMKNKDRCSH